MPIFEFKNISKQSLFRGNSFLSDRMSACVFVFFYHFSLERQEAQRERERERERSGVCVRCVLFYA
jgi:hypothetical protein